MYSRRIAYLFYRHLDNMASPEESLELAELLLRYENQDRIKILIQEAWDASPSEKLFNEAKSDELLRSIIERSQEESSQQALGELDHHWSFPWKRLAIAATVLLAVGTSLFLLKPKRTPVPPAIQVPISKIANDIAPGTNKAILTLDDGKNIVLDNESEGLLAKEEHVNVIKKGDDQLAYEVASQGDASKIAYNTLSTPRGGQYKLILPDGSKVWLNAASSIRYPTLFNANARKVQIVGEAYFEISRQTAPDGKKIPFTVEANGIAVEVLGTHFNINAYNDEEKIKTTLLEGMVKIHKGKSESLLRPGQQANVSLTSPQIQIQRVNTGQVIAWKNGFFQFHQASLDEIMRQITKWYDVEVKYIGTTSTRKFSGEIPREASLLQVLEILELSNVQLDIKGKEIIIKS